MSACRKQTRLPADLLLHLLLRCDCDDYALGIIKFHSATTHTDQVINQLSHIELLYVECCNTIVMTAII